MSNILPPATTSPKIGRLSGAVLMISLGVAAGWPGWQELLSLGLQSTRHSHILLAIAVAAYLVWQRRATLADCSGSSWLGPLLIVWGASAGWLGGYGGWDTVRYLGVIAVAFGAVVALVGQRGLWLLVPSVAALCLMIPVPGIVIDRIAQPLAEFNAWLVGEVLKAASVPLEVYGGRLEMAGIEVVLEEDCGGLPLLWASLVMSYAVAFALPLSVGARALILASSPWLALLGNAVRLVVTVGLYCSVSPELASMFHDAAGLLIVGSAWLVPYLAARGLARWSPPVRAVVPVQSSPDRPGPDRAFTLNGRAFALGLLVLLIAGRLASSPGDRNAFPGVPAVQGILADVPYCFGEWIGRDVPLSAAQQAVLEPDALLHRHFVHAERGESFLLTAVFHRDGLTHAGHGAPRCYAAAGWQLEGSTTQSITVAGEQITGTDFVFARRSRGGARRIAVVEAGFACAVRPSTSLRQASFVSGAPREAGRVLLVFDDQVSPADRRQLSAAALEGLAPFWHLFRSGDLGQPQALLTRR